MHPMLKEALNEQGLLLLALLTGMQHTRCKSFVHAGPVDITLHPFMPFKHRMDGYINPGY